MKTYKDYIKAMASLDRAMDKQRKKLRLQLDNLQNHCCHRWMVLATDVYNCRICGLVVCKFYGTNQM